MWPRRFSKFVGELMKSSWRSENLIKKMIFKQTDLLFYKYAIWRKHFGKKRTKSLCSGKKIMSYHFTVENRLWDVFYGTTLFDRPVGEESRWRALVSLRETLQIEVGLCEQQNSLLIKHTLADHYKSLQCSLCELDGMPYEQIRRQ